MIKTFGRVAGLSLALGTAAAAAPATPDEAQRLTALFERYIGHPAGQPSAVTVRPHGDSYTASFDVSRLFAMLSAAGYAVTASPVVTELTPQDDGRWHVLLDGLPIVGFAKGEQAFSMSIKGYRFDGLFDPRIQAIASAKTMTAGSVTHANGPKGSMDVALTETGTGSYGATDAGAGTINAKAGSSIKDFAYKVDSVTPSDEPGGKGAPFGFAAKGSDITTAVSLDNERVVALNDLWAFLVAHASKEALVADQPALKTKLKALLPFATGVTGDITLANLMVSTPKGDFGAARFAEHYAFGAAAKDGVLTTLTLAGLTLPAELVPAWAKPLVPTGFDITQTYGPLTMTPALTMAIDDLDLAANPPLSPEQQQAVFQALGGDGMAIGVSPSTITTGLMTVTFDGEAHLTKPMPTGTATVAVKGLDKTIEAIRAGSPDDPDAMQAIGFLSAVKVLAKADGVDSYSWKVVAAPGAAITVNGTPLAATAPAPMPGPKAKAHKKKGDADTGSQGHVHIP